MHSPRGASFVVIALPDGRRRSIRRSITDLAAAGDGEHPGTADETLRVSIRTLLPLAQHLATMITASEQRVIHHGPTLSLEPEARFSDQAAPAPLSAPPIRPWPNLPTETQTQMAQLLAELVRRMHPLPPIRETTDAERHEPF
ncbi:hypothetical protein KBI52_04815 [Microvirga sp. HBU67558]|nr:MULTISPECIES: hypothetical protein [unclassified Microvirga]MBQ0819542.1 hypothetical protein [Microvirga sp. HBU67558]